MRGGRLDQYSLYQACPQSTFWLHRYPGHVGRIESLSVRLRPSVRVSISGHEHTEKTQHSRISTVARQGRRILEVRSAILVSCQESLSRHHLRKRSSTQGTQACSTMVQRSDTRHAGYMLAWDQTGLERYPWMLFHVSKLLETHRARHSVYAGRLRRDPAPMSAHVHLQRDQ
jgi:hypothetical protein